MTKSTAHAGRVRRDGTSSTTTETPPEGHRLHRGLLLLMAVATGLSCAGNYLAHPLLDLIRQDLGIGSTLAGLIVTASQAGYALGLLLLVPLGDVVDRRRLTVALFGATTVFLLLTAAAPTGPVLLAGTVLTALASVGAQVVVAHAAALAVPAERGQVVATVVSGLLMGGLLARTASGGLAELGGWRTAYYITALLMAMMVLLVRRHLPRPRDGAACAAPHGTRAPESPRTYPALLLSTRSLLGQEPLLRWRCGIGALAMASYSVQFTALTFLLAEPPYGWSEAGIGLFGLLGAVGILTMTLAARLGDRGHVQAVTGAGVTLLGGAWLLLLASGESPSWLALGVIALNVAGQAVLNSCQTILYGLRPEARNRINSAFMTSYFAGGASGSALASVLWSYGGWHSVCVLGMALAGGALTMWLLERAGARRAPARSPRA